MGEVMGEGPFITNTRLIWELGMSERVGLPF